MSISGITGVQHSHDPATQLKHKVEKMSSTFLGHDSINNDDAHGPDDHAGDPFHGGEGAHLEKELGRLVKSLTSLLKEQSNPQGNPSDHSHSPDTVKSPNDPTKPKNTPDSAKATDPTKPTDLASGATAPNAPTTGAAAPDAPTAGTPASAIDKTNGPISLADASVRADPKGTNYISDAMLQNAKANGGQLQTKAQYDAFVDANAGKFGLDPAVVKREYRVESGGYQDHIGDTTRSAADGGHSIGLLQVSQGLLAGGVWAHPGTETTGGTQLTQGDLENNPEVQLLAGMQHLADYKNEAAASLGAGASPEAIYTQALGNYVGHDQAQYISNIENMALT